MDRAAYYLALDGVTRYGLAAATRKIMQGALGHAFMPSPPELRIQCDRAMEPHERMAERVRRHERENAEWRKQFGTPVERTEQSKTRVSAVYQQFLDGYRDEQAEAEEAEHAAIRARYGMTDEALAEVKDNPKAHARMGKNS